MSTKILLSILHLSKTLAVILQKEFLFPPYSSKGHRSLCDRDSLIAQFSKDLPMNLIHRQFFDAVWGRMRLRHPERKDCFQTVMGRDMQRALHIFLRASPIGSSRSLPWIQQLPSPKASAIKCILAIAIEQSSTHTSDFSASANTTIAQSACCSIFADPIRHSDSTCSIFRSRTTTNSHGRIERLEAESNPACSTFLSASSAIGCPV